MEPNDWKKANVIPICKEEDPGNYRLVSLTLIPGKVIEQLILETIPSPMNSKIGSSQCGLTKGKSLSTGLINLYNEMTGLIDEDRNSGYCLPRL